MLLSDAPCGKNYRVGKITADKNERQRLSSLNIKEGSFITVFFKNASGVVFYADGIQVGVSPSVAKMIEVEDARRQ